MFYINMTFKLGKVNFFAKSFSAVFFISRVCSLVKMIDITDMLLFSGYRCENSWTVHWFGCIWKNLFVFFEIISLITTIPTYFTKLLLFLFNQLLGNQLNKYFIFKSLTFNFTSCTIVSHDDAWYYRMMHLRFLKLWRSKLEFYQELSRNCLSTRNKRN